MKGLLQRRAPRPRFLKLSYFAWLVVPLGLWLTFDAFGLPHGLWSYSWFDQGQGMDPFAERYYTRCTYAGPFGEFAGAAENGRCPWVKFFQAGAE